MAQTVKLKRSSVAGNIPTTGQMTPGELAMNTADGKLFLRDDSTVRPIVTTDTEITGSLNLIGNITSSGHISATTYYGDGSNLTGISGGGSTFPYTGSAIISGSLKVIGDITGSGKIDLNDGNNSVYIGELAGNSNNNNTFIGYDAGGNSSNSVAIGYQAGRTATNGNNVYIGYQTGDNAEGGTYRVALGAGAGTHTRANHEISIGRSANRFGTGESSIAIGRSAAYGSGANTKTNLIAIGQNTGYGSDGTYNTHFQLNSGRNTTGNYNITLGANSGYTTTGDYNIILGTDAGYTVSGSNNILLGYQAGYNLTGSNQLIIANNSSSALVTGDFANNTFNISGSVSASTYYGDGSNLTGISSDPFPYTGDVEITGSNSLAGSYALKVANSSGTDILSIENNNEITLGTTPYTPNDSSQVSNSNVYARGGVYVANTGNNFGMSYEGNRIKYNNGYGRPSLTFGNSDLTFSHEVNAPTFHASSTVKVGGGLGNKIGTTGGNDLDLTISGYVDSSDTSNGYSYIQLYGGNHNPNKGKLLLAAGNNATYSNIEFYTTGSERMRISNNGDIGIGVTDPKTNLHVSGAVSASTYYGDGSNLTGISGGGSTFPYTGSAEISGSLEVIGDITGSKFLATNGIKSTGNIDSGTNKVGLVSTWNQYMHPQGSSGEFRFNNGAGGGFFYTWVQNGDERMRLSTSNYLGIGTPSPQERLHVAGNAIITGSNSLAGSYALKVANSSGTNLVTAENDGTVELNNKVFVNGTDINYSTAAYALNISESVNIRGVINFDNASHQAWIKTANSTQRAIKIPGTGGHGYFQFYNTIGNGIQLLNSSAGNATLTLRSPSVDGNNSLIGISQGSSLGYGGGYFIYYDSTSNKRIYTFGNLGSEGVGNEDGTSVRLTASPAGTIGTRKGGNVYIISTPGSSGGIDGKVHITGSTEITGSLNVIGDITGSNISASTYYGDGSNLTGIDTDPFPYTGSAVISGSLTITGSTNINANGTNIVEVTQASDLPTTLTNNTTYIVRGNITIPGGSEITAGQFNAIIGLDRDKDKLTYSGTGNFITVTDETFLMQNLGLSSTNASSCILSASNIAASGYNNSRDEFLSIINCQFRNVAGNVMDVKGFDLVDFNNTTFFYCESPDFGCKFQDVSKLEISSCEFIRWFDETSIPTPSGYATCPMIELDVNNHASFGAVNISGCIIHPQQTQFAILVNSGSTTGFGTIAANAFVNVGITTGGILGQSTYDSSSMLKYDVFGNQGLENSSAELFATVTGNTTTTVLGRGNAVQVDFGANENVRTAQRFGFDTVNEYITYKGSKDIKVLIAGTLVGEKAGGGSETYTVDLRKDSGGGFVTIPGSSTEFTTSGGTVSITKNLIVSVSQNDNLAIFISSAGGDDFTAQDLQLTITEV